MDMFFGIGLGLALVGALLAWYGIRRHRRNGERHARAVATWVKTRATILDARLVENETSDSDGDSTTWYEPRLRYGYAVGGMSLEGNRTALCEAPRFSLLDPAQKWLLAHAPGGEIDLWYDPEHPEDSAPTLDKPSLFSAAMLVIVGGGFIGVGAIMMAGLV